MTQTVVTLPLRIESVLNKREHWRARHRRAKANRAAARYIPTPPLPVTVVLCRIAPRRLDGDNLQAAFKALRDGIADRYGIPDNDPRIRWDYDQQRGKPHEYAARITITRRDEG
ncbi:hypothetical protein J5226_12850 [Lysobacter sp. K5869]|uniref:hypothetical protein n=1 Tax=Lysobacter sp. K5869 TaxID=2820808 RepID=UPI001C0615F0|nr:hypothetical protein [Lysobacter sp. K5869]QWP79213.1 hypothetical protein J5226_12850 [Lysobacter sp. K5869]